MYSCNPLFLHRGRTSEHGALYIYISQKPSFVAFIILHHNQQKRTLSSFKKLDYYSNKASFPRLRERPVTPRTGFFNLYPISSFYPRQSHSPHRTIPCADIRRHCISAVTYVTGCGKNVIRIVDMTVHAPKRYSMERWRSPRYYVLLVK